MHGTVLLLLKRYVQTTFDHSTWVRLTDAAGLPFEEFDHQQTIQDEDFYALVSGAAHFAELPVTEFYENFGRYLVPDLLQMFGRHIDPSWSALDLLERAESELHPRVRQTAGGFTPPILQVERSGDRVRIEYVSDRGLASLAIGIVRGVIQYYGESGYIKVTPQLRNQGREALIEVERCEHSQPVSIDAREHPISRRYLPPG